MKGYREDLSYIHDVGFTRFAARSAPGILRMLKEARQRGLVVELGCGSGVLARRLVDAGYEVLGVDSSPAMLALARRKAPRARFLTGSFLKVALPPCAAVIAIGEVFNYRFDADNRSRKLYRFFGRVHDALLPGGVFIFDLAGPGRGHRGGPVRTFRTGKTWAVLVESEERRFTLTRRITAFRAVERLYRRSEEMHVLNLYSRAEVLTELRRAGFTARALRGYGQTRLDRGHLAYVARRS